MFYFFNLKTPIKEMMCTRRTRIGVVANEEMHILGTDAYSDDWTSLPTCSVFTENCLKRLQVEGHPKGIVCWIQAHVSSRFRIEDGFILCVTIDGHKATNLRKITILTFQVVIG